ncbi:RodZ domain-containing protein [Shewanella sp. SR44-3]|uniref:RodZ domain-containing protein n=1 Tax=Shewanella sp. SR44-3 TaxID=2760936 RepID=UPI0015FC762F|nr:RodZ domain-containing protein [Shewanella sp. SR44-3]MBB1268146.1 DUF4115 domain-containing protein [Shewanella sp. SR44-3]
MTNNELDLNPLKQVDPSSDITTVGAVLRKAREGKGLSIQEVAIQLHLRPGIITDLENDKFDAMSSMTYVRGYVKNYARFIDADIELIKTCLIAQLPQEVAPSMQSFSRKTTKQARDKRLLMFTYVLVFTLLALLVLWWVQKSSLLSDVDVSQPSMEEVAATEQEQALEAFEISQLAQSIPELEHDGVDLDASQIDAAPVTNESLAAEQTGADPIKTAPNAGSGAANGNVNAVATQAETTQAADVPSESASQAPAVQTLINSNEIAAVQVDPQNASVADSQPSAVSLGDGDKLSVELSGDSWMKVVDSTGKVLIDGVKASGRTIQVAGKAPFSLIIGAPKFVSLSFNGEQVDISEYLDGRVARFTIPEA